MRKQLSEEEQKEYLLSKIGKPVGFEYPEPGFPSEGILKDRHVFKAHEDDAIVYWDLIDLIDFKDHDEKWLRVTYYRYKKKVPKWNYSGQNSLCEPLTVFEDLFAGGVKERPWIRQFFKNITARCSEELE